MPRTSKLVIKQTFNLQRVVLSTRRDKARKMFVNDIGSLVGFCCCFVLSFSLIGSKGTETKLFLVCREYLGWDPPKALHFNPPYVCRRDQRIFWGSTISSIAAYFASRAFPDHLEQICRQKRKMGKMEKIEKTLCSLWKSILWAPPLREAGFGRVFPRMDGGNTAAYVTKLWVCLSESKVE